MKIKVREENQMKKVNITISFEDEKLDALSFFMGKENTSPQKELDDSLKKIYEKYVPEQMREYLASRIPALAKEKPKRPTNPSAQKQPSPAPVQKPQPLAPVPATPEIKEEK
jgi:hypothetical protein